MAIPCKKSGSSVKIYYRWQNNLSIKPVLKGENQ
jgi:hypothetical protein